MDGRTMETKTAKGGANPHGPWDALKKGQLVGGTKRENRAGAACPPRK